MSLKAQFLLIFMGIAHALPLFSQNKIEVKKDSSILPILRGVIQNHGFELLDMDKGIALLKKKNKQKETHYYLQIVDIQAIAVNQYFVETKNAGLNQGKYFMGEKGYKSPYFKMLSHSKTQQNQQVAFGKNYFGVMNCSFFEEHKPETQLSFPMKKDGQVLTGGSSPFGPFSKPNDKYFKNITLKSLVWNDKDIEIKNYNTETGYPLTDSVWTNGLVSYNYLDHPANLYRPAQANRFHLVSTIKDAQSNRNFLLILTSTDATLTEAGAFLKKINNNSDIMTIDGGASVFIHNRKFGNLEQPRMLNPDDPTSYSLLPHYWVFVLKN